MNNESKKDLFVKIDKHLMEDSKPSIFLNDLMVLEEFHEYPFAIISNLEVAEQSPVYHPEGNAWKHTLLVVDEAAKVKAGSSDSRVFMWAALLHDVGKPDTTKKRKGKITSYDHDKLGSKMATEFLEQFDEDKAFIEKVVPLVRWHMQLLFVVKDLPFADIEGMKSQVPINDIALLGLSDRMGRVGADEKQEKENIKIFLEKCAK